MNSGTSFLSRSTPWIFMLFFFFSSCDFPGCEKKSSSSSPTPTDEAPVGQEVTENDNNSSLDQETPNAVPEILGNFWGDLREGVHFKKYLSFEGGLSPGAKVEVLEMPDWLSFNAQDLSVNGTPPLAASNSRLTVRVSFEDQTKDTTVKLNIKTDPLLPHFWHHINSGQSSFSQTGGQEGVDLNLRETVRQDVTGSGVLIAVSDFPAETGHEDLAANHWAAKSRDYTKTLYDTVPEPGTDAHGTAVTGIISAVGWNNIGGRGVAPGSRFATFNFLGSDQTDAILLSQISGDYDIFNQSWGLNLTRVQTLDLDYLRLLKSRTESGRSGKGPIYVRAAGNNYNVCADFLCSENSSTDPFNTTPYTINVAALNADGEHASYSTTGSGIWISAPGGEFGEEKPAIVTTDIQGCEEGYSKEGASENDFESGDVPQNKNCHYTSTFNGTSAAAPSISGAAALMLEVNPQLSWRDVKFILAKTAIKNDSDFSPRAIPGLAIDYARGWFQNAAGFPFHTWFGFGQVNIDEAVKLARDYNNYLPRIQETTNWDTNSWKYSNGTDVTIPDFSDSGASSQITVTEDWPLEAVQVRVDVTHPYPNEVMIELISPNGTRNTILNTFNSLISEENIEGMIILSNAFYRENPTGTWTLKVYDTLREDSGTLRSWQLNLIGDE